MHRDWLAMEHYRLHVMEQWPDSPRKVAGLAAVRATLESLDVTAPAGDLQFVCADCLAKRRSAEVIEFPLVEISAMPRAIAA